MKNSNSLVPWLTFALAILLSHTVNPSPHRAFARARMHLTGGGEPLCGVVAQPSVVCPEHDSKGTFEFTVLIEGDMKAAVTAYTDIHWVRVHGGSTSFAIPIGIQPRNDVKEYIRGWCQLFRDVNEAHRVASEVEKLFAERIGYETKHKTLREDVMEVEDEIDGIRRRQASFFTQQSSLLDAFEKSNTSSRTYHLILKDRQESLDKGNKRQASDEKRINQLKGKIAGKESQIDENLKKIDEVDKKISALLGQPKECRVAEVEEVIFRQAPGARGLDANPNMEGGQRIFPDATEHDGAEDRRVEVRALVKPRVAGLRLYFKLFDRDDPLSDSPLLDPTGVGGRDNFARKLVPSPDPEAPPTEQVELEKGELEGGGAEAQKVTDAQGEARVELLVTTQPGHNFEVAVDCHEEGVRKYDDDAASNNSVPHRLSSGMLTVWRKVWLEMDSLPALPRTLPNHVVSGRIRSSVVSDDRKTAEVEIEVDAEHQQEALGDSPHRWTGGRLEVPLVGFPSFEIVSSNILDPRIVVTVTTFRVPGGQDILFPPNEPLNVAVRLYDDDFRFTGGGAR